MLFKLFSAVVLAGSAFICAQALEVKIKSGNEAVPVSRIILSSSASPKDRDTAKEAARIIGSLTGKAPEIIGKDSVSSAEMKGAFLIGNDVFEKNSIQNELKKFPFGYVVKIADGGLILGGTDANTRADGLYRLFERHGMKFYIRNLREYKLYPGMETLEEAPKKKEIVFQDSYSEKVRFARTSSEVGGTRGNPRTTKEVKAHVYGLLWTSHAHDLMVPYSIYGKTHPEYYALLSNGKRMGKTNSMGVHLCMSNPDLPAIAAANIINWIGQQPWATYFDISPSDGPNWCTCKNCTALDVSGHGRSDRLWRFNNKVAELVGKKYPDKKLVCLAYTPNSEPPPAGGKIAGNCVVLFAPYCWGGARSQFHSLDAPRNRTAYRNFLAWMKILKPGQMIGFEYPPSYCLYPSAGMKPMFEKIKLLDRYPQVFALDYCGFSSNSFYKLSRYVLAELEWNPRLDTDKMITDFMKHYYGPAAPCMRAIYDLNAEIANKKPHFVRCEYYAPGLLADGRAEKFYALFGEAEKAAASNPEFLKRVRIEKVPYLFVDLTENNPANGKASFESSFPAKLQEFLSLCVNVKNPDFRTISNRDFLAVRPGERISKWMRDICGFTPETANIYQSAEIRDFLNSENPAAFLKQHCRLTNAEPYGIGISLRYGSGNKVIPYTQKEHVEIAADESVPQAQLWGGNMASKSNTFDVVAQKNGETSAFSIEFLDNPYNGQLEVTAMNENAPCETVISVLYNNGIKNQEVFRKKVRFDSPGRWIRFTLPAPASALQYAQNRFTLKNEPVEAQNAGKRRTGKDGKRLLIRKLRLLY